MQKKHLWIGLGVLLLAILLWVLYPNKGGQQSLTTTVQSGEFVVSVVTTGELDAKNSVEINGPTDLQSVQIWSEIKLEDLIDEGTVVDSGAYIGRLDKTQILNKLKDIESNLEKLDSQIRKLKLDSALTLRSARDQLINLAYAAEEARLEVQNSQYEPPAVQRKAEISAEKAQRTLKQARENYKLKKNKEEASIKEVMIDYQKATQKKDRVMQVMQGFDIYAPQAGMVVYAKKWDGTKIKVGSMISPWRPVVASLPDLTQMLIKTYVNEIDISKVKAGQEVEIGVDAFPQKQLQGIVRSVANIGEQMPNSSAHVFEVIIDVEGQDADLRPAMTTKNTIVTNTLDSVLYIPLECLHMQDSVPFVYTTSRKQAVETALSNSDNIVITKGLSAGDELYLLPPENAKDWTLNRL